MATFEKIKTYLSTGNIDPIWDDQEVMVWIDWREYDVDLVNYFSDRIGEEVLYGMEKDDYNVDIVYKGKNYPIPYPKDHAERDITLTYLNNVISDEYEIRFALESDGSDTLAFSILRNEEWKTLEDEYGKEAVDKAYRKLRMGEAIFGG